MSQGFCMCHQWWGASATLGSLANCHSAGCGDRDTTYWERVLDKPAQTSTARAIRRRYRGCKSAAAPQRGRHQLRTLSKSVIGVVQNTVPDGAAIAALADGRMIWVAVWIQSTSSLTQISSAQSSLSGSLLEAFQHVRVARTYLSHHSTPLDESRGETQRRDKMFLSQEYRIWVGVFEIKGGKETK